VHLAKSGYPLLADVLYGREKALPELGLYRHALHAHRLAFTHPVTGKKLSFEAEIADDIKEARSKLTICD
jgi:23S rRNA pseudouridine1911/1915/1917 synthase